MRSFMKVLQEKWADDPNLTEDEHKCFVMISAIKKPVEWTKAEKERFAKVID